MIAISVNILLNAFQNTNINLTIYNNLSLNTEAVVIFILLINEKSQTEDFKDNIFNSAQLLRILSVN